MMPRTAPRALSRTAARRQAHAESSIHPDAHLYVVVTYSPVYECKNTSRRMPWFEARTYLKEWRISRVCQLLGAGQE